MAGISTDRWANAATGTVVHLENYGIVKVFRIISRDGTAEHWATNDSGTAGASPFTGFRAPKIVLEFLLPIYLWFGSLAFTTLFP